jgi:polysaccharide biosynthesis/export protein
MAAHLPLPMPISLVRSIRLTLLLSALVAGCSQLPTTGPSRKEIEQVTVTPGTTAIQVVDVDDAVVRRLLAQRVQQLFSEALAGPASSSLTIGSGDGLEVVIWESPPATLFGAAVLDPRTSATASATVLPEQIVDDEGFISVPFAGRIRASGQTPQGVAAEVVRRLKGRANQPEVLVRQTRNTSAMVTVVGEVTQSVRMPLTPSRERLLDALAAAGGVRQPVHKTTVQITRGNRYHSLPLDTVIRDPRQNVPLHAGDVVTVVFQPLSFTALGATGKQDEIAFEAQGITIAQGLARAGGLVDSRSNPQGVFIFRFERKDALVWPRAPVTTTPDGLVPVVYRLDLRDPASFFVMQSFAVNDRDIVYVSNAPAAELQKFLNLVFSIAYPVLNAINATN